VCILEDGKIHIYSRNSENNTTKYPDIIARIPKVKKDSVKSCVLDAEAVAWDAEKKQIQPFQVLSHRKRKV
jgi:DNA ligase-1